MAIKAISTTTSFPSTGWTKEQVTEETVNRLFVQKFKEIVSSYEERKKVTSPGDLAIGPWYPNDFALASEKHKRGNMLDFLVKTHSFYHGFPPKGFNIVSDPKFPTKISPCAYDLQKGVLPTEALDNVQNGQFSFIDCGIAVELGRYETVREIGGEERLNVRFSSDGACPLRLRPLMSSSPLFALGLMKEVHYDTDAISPQFGDNVHFSNVSFYLLKHLNGESAGFNAVCISPSSEQDKKYIAFGLPVEGKTENGMNDVLHEEFNTIPIDLSLIFTEALVNHLRKEAKEKEAKFTAVAGEKISSCKIDREAFELLVQHSNHDVGLRPVAHRFDIEGIRKYLSS
jgi:hypothetical protein